MAIEQSTERLLDAVMDADAALLDHLDRAIRVRRKQLADRLKLSLQVGDRVRLSQTARPEYIRGMTARVARITPDSVFIVLDDKEKAGRFSTSEEVRCPVTILERM
jgi:hypothetical protein